MITALLFGLDDQRPRFAGDLGPEARSGDPAADDDNVILNHFRRRLRIGKPRRLGVRAMFNGAFTENVLLVGLAAILVVAAAIDVRTFTISNKLNLAAALALWFSPQSTIKFLVLTSLAGGVLTLGIIAWHRARQREGRPEIPYG